MSFRRNSVRLAFGLLAAPAAALVLAGCDAGPSQAAEQAQMMRDAQALCATHGGVAYLNFDGESDLDEVRCRKDRP